MANIVYNGFTVNQTVSALWQQINGVNNAWKDGISCTYKYFEKEVGAVGINKVNKRQDIIRKPGDKYNHQAPSNSTATMLINNMMIESREVHDVLVEQLASDTGLQDIEMEATMIINLEKAEKMITGKVAYDVITGGGQVAYGESLTTYAGFKTSYRGSLLALKQNPNGTVRPNFIMPNPSVYYLMKEGTIAEFTPNTNEITRSMGILGSYDGNTVLEFTVGGYLTFNNVNNEAFYDYDKSEYTEEVAKAPAGTKAVNGDAINYILGNNDDISVGIAGPTGSFKDAIDFDGVYVRNRFVVGAVVPTPNRVAISLSSADVDATIFTGTKV